MNSLHDMGGAMGFGKVEPEIDEPPYHAEWEERAMALTIAMGATGQWNLDMSRSARESLPPLLYLSSSYYEIWIAALEKLLAERGLVSADELAGRAPQPGAPLRVLAASQVDAGLAAGSPTERAARTPARFAAGDRVRARNLNPQGHTRLPRYVRGHLGTVALVHGAHIYPDRHVTRTVPPFDQAPEWLYTVVFDGAELWGDAAAPGLQVSVDAWEPYLEAA